MAITFDNAADVAGTLLNPSTGSYTVGTGTNRVLVIEIFSHPTTVTAVTYNGVSMTAGPTSTSLGTTYQGSSWYLLNPATGSNTLSATLTSTVGLDAVYFECASYSGVGSVDDVQCAADTGTKTTVLTINGTSLATGSWGVNMAGGNGASITASTNINSVRVSNAEGAFFVGDSNASLGAPGVYSVGFQQNPADWWYSGATFIIAPSGGTVATPTLLTLNVG